MNSRSLAFLSTGHATSQVLENYNTTLTGPALQAAHAELKTRLEEIELLAHQQSEPTVGKTVNRHKLYDEAAEAVRIVARLTLRYARQEGLPEVIDHVEVPARRLTHGRFRHRLEAMQHVEAAATAQAEALVPYGVTPAMLTDVKAKIKAAAERPSAHSAIEQRCVATQRLAAAFAELEELLTNGLDPLMELLRLSHPVEFAAYRQARMVIELPGTPSGATEAKTAADAPAPASTTAAPVVPAHPEVQPLAA